MQGAWGGPARPAGGRSIEVLCNAAFTHANAHQPRRHPLASALRRVDRRRSRVPELTHSRAALHAGALAWQSWHLRSIQRFAHADQREQGQHRNDLRDSGKEGGRVTGKVRRGRHDKRNYSSPD